jgi:hypothetical protein
MSPTANLDYPFAVGLGAGLGEIERGFERKGEAKTVRTNAAFARVVRTSPGVASLAAVFGSIP